MRTNHKPDLLFLLVVFVGFGVLLSSYIQYERREANEPENTSLAVKQSTMEHKRDENQFVLVSTPADTISLANGDAVNNSLQEP